MIQTIVAKSWTMPQVTSGRAFESSSIALTDGGGDDAAIAKVVRVDTTRVGPYGRVKMLLRRDCGWHGPCSVAGTIRHGGASWVRSANE